MLKSLLEAVKFGNKVSAIAVQTKGAQPSILRSSRKYI